MKLASLWLLGAAAAWSGCLAVPGDRILARDMARGWPEFSAVAPETPLGYAPAPGAHRTFGPLELRHLAQRYGVREPAADEFCFELATAPVTADRIERAMRAALDLPEARISIDELSRYPAPDGEIVFPRGGLRAPAAGDAPVLWRGYVLYSGGRRFALWARVRIAAPLDEVRAAETLRAGEPVGPDQVRVERVLDFPCGPARARSAAQVVGRRPRRTIPAGAALALDLLDAPREVERGEMVRVKVSRGAAHLAITGRAETSGDRGQIVQVRNPASNRTFAARVAGKGQAIVDTGGEQ